MIFLFRKNVLFPRYLDFCVFGEFNNFKVYHIMIDIASAAFRGFWEDICSRKSRDRSTKCFFPSSYGKWGKGGAGGLEGVILQVSVPKIIYYLHHFLLKEQKFIHMLTKQQCNQNHMQCAEIYPRGGYKERIVNFACL